VICRPGADGIARTGLVHHRLVIGSIFSSLRARALATASAVGSDELVTAGAAAVEAPDYGAAKARILLLPMGAIDTRDGRHFQLDDEAHAAAVVAASRHYAGRRDIPVDYDHQLVFAVGKDKRGRAPAAGWIKPETLTVTAAGIEADVTWTTTAAEALARREYRYFSPTFTTDKAGRITSIRFGSLVNDHAIDALPAIAAASIPDVNPQETDVNYAKIAAALGLPPEASEDDILAAITAMAMPKAMMTAAAAQFGLAETATAQEIVTAATATAAAAAAAAPAEPDPAKYVPIEAFNDVSAQLATASAAAQAGEAERLVTAAAEAGKVSPALKGWATNFAATNIDGFKAWVEKAPVIVAAGAVPAEQINAAAAGSGGDGLTDSERAVIKLTGVTADAFIAAKKKGI